MVASIVESYPSLRVIKEVTLIPSEVHDGAYAALLGPLADE